MAKPTTSVVTFEALEEKYGLDLLVEILDALKLKAQSSYTTDDPNYLNIEKFYNLVQTKGSVAAAIAAIQGKSPESNTKSNPPAEPVPKPSNSDHMKAGLQQIQKAEDEQTILAAAASEYTAIRKYYRVKSMTREAFALGRLPKDARLAEMHNTALKEAQQYFGSQEAAFFGSIGDSALGELDFQNFGNHLNTGEFSDSTELDLLFHPAPPVQPSISGQP